MYADHVIGVVIPAHNEEGHIGGVIRTIPDYVDRIYLVDDASTDRTWEEAIEIAAEEEHADDLGARARQSAIADGGNNPSLEHAFVHDLVGRVLPIQHRSNRGAGGAIKTGYLAAREDEMDITVTMDGDGQMDPAHMARLLDPIVSGRADYAKGNRLVYREFREEMPRFRYVGNMMLTMLTKIASGYWKTMDPQNGYTAISRAALESIRVETLFEYYGYCNDILVKLNANGMRVADVPMPAVYGDEQSSIRYPTYIVKVSRMLLHDFLWRLKTRYLVTDFHPLAFFYFLGVCTVGLGVLAGVSTVLAFVAGNAWFGQGAFSVVLFLLGSMFLLFAMVFDMLANEHREIQIHD